MDFVVNKIEAISGSVKVPGDKSISHRSIILGSISKGTTYVRDILLSEDVQRTIGFFKKLGVSIEQKNKVIALKGMAIEDFRPYTQELDMGNSGTSARLLLGLISGSPHAYVLNGDPFLKKRPMKRVTKPLEQMGAHIEYLEREDLLQIKIKGGNLRGIHYKLPVASAQIKSALILAGLHCSGKTVIEEPVATRDHTEIMIQHFGGTVEKNNHFIQIKGNQRLLANEVLVPGDISSAAFLLVLSAIVPKAELMIEDVGLNPTRSGILHVLESMGARMEILEERVVNGERVGNILIRHSCLKAVTIEGDIIPTLIDEIPILAVAATQAEGITVIRDAQELKVKESNRIDTVVSQLKKMGANIEASHDGMIIQGPTKLKGATIDSEFDHRIAMAFAVAGMVAEGETKILKSECIAVSFPEFTEILKKISK